MFNDKLSKDDKKRYFELAMKKQTQVMIIMMMMIMMMMMIIMMVCRTSSRGSTLVWVTASTDTRPCGGRGGGRGSPGSRGRGASSRATDMTLAS